MRAGRLMNSGIGQALPRKEDHRLLTGKGRYSDDVDMPGQAYAHMVRSVHAHAVIRAIETAPARALTVGNRSRTGRRPAARPISC